MTVESEEQQDNNIIYWIERRKNNRRTILLILFFINPFWGWIVSALVVFTPQKNNVKNLFMWIIFSILFISLYNATKIPENDLEWYVDFYLSAGNTGFSDYLLMLSGGKEQLYQIIAYAIYLLGGANPHFYIFVISVISYSFLSRALYIYTQSLKISQSATLFCFFMLFFFPYLFALSVHLVRQFLAISIMIYVLVYKGVNGRGTALMWILAFASMFIHTSTALFIPFLFVNQLRYEIGKKNLLLLIFVFVSIVSLKVLALFLLPFVADNPLTYLAEKAAYGTHFETELPSHQLVFSVLLVTTCFYFCYISKFRLKYFPAVSFFFNISLVLLFFIIMNADQSELQLRYNFCYWLFSPFFFAIYLKGIKCSSSLLGIGCLLLFIFWNIYNIKMSQWTYTCDELYFIYPIFQYFI